MCSVDRRCVLVPELHDVGFELGPPTISAQSEFALRLTPGIQGVLDGFSTTDHGTQALGLTSEKTDGLPIWQRRPEAASVRASPTPPPSRMRSTCVNSRAFALVEHRRRSAGNDGPCRERPVSSVNHRRDGLGPRL